jgi:hypothetical protein
MMSEAASPTGLSGTSMVVPIVNVSALSQAWIDALGLARHQPAPTRGNGSHPLGLPQEHASCLGRANGKSPSPRGESRVALQSSATRPRAALPVYARERTANIERMRVSKKIASVHPPQPDVFRRSVGRVTIISRRGVIRLLLQRDGSQLRVTAICDPRLVSTVSDALRTTHLAHAARGITAQIEVHPEKVEFS